jgi:MFS superfamily sulfate permease-like transporter
MNDAHQTPVEEAISFLTIAAILLAVGCYAAAVQNIPVASPALFWVATMVYHWIPALNAIKASQMPMLVSAAMVGGTFFVVGIPFAGLLATWFSSAQIANLERQTAKLQRNRARIQKQRRDRDRYDAR